MSFLLNGVSGYDPVSVDGGCGNEHAGLINLRNFINRIIAITTLKK
jgi:hypothetical protein